MFLILLKYGSKRTPKPNLKHMVVVLMKIWYIKIIVSSKRGLPKCHIFRPFFKHTLNTGGIPEKIQYSEQCKNTHG